MAHGGLSIFIGPDRSRKRERVAALAQELKIALLDRHHVVADQLSPAAVGSLIREYPVASPLRFVVIDDAHRLHSACLAVLEAQAKQPNHTSCVILLVEAEVGAGHPLSALWAHATIEEFNWLSPAACSRWIRQQVAAHKKRMTEAAIHALVQAYGGADASGLRAMLDQLIAWVGPRPTIDQPDVEVFLPRSAARRPGDVVRAIARRDVAAAFLAIDEHLRTGKEVLELLGLVIWQLQRWLTVKRLLEAGYSRKQLASRMGLAAWQLDRLEEELAGRSVESLQQQMQACWELDVAAKTGRAIPRVGLEQVVVEMCLPRPFVAHETLSVSEALNRT